MGSILRLFALTFASLAFMTAGARAQQPSEIVIGALYPLSGANAQIGVDARHAYETALDIINNVHDLDLPLARSAGLPNLGGAKVRLIFADHQSDPQKGRAEAERLITQEKVVALIGTYQSAVANTASVTAERYGIPFMGAEVSSPSLHRRNLKYFFRAAPHDEMFTATMFEFYAYLKAAKGINIESVSLFFEDTIFGTDSSNVQRKLAGEHGIKVLGDVKYRSNSPSLTAEVQQLKAANAQVLMPSSYTTDAILLMKTMKELGYQPPAIVAQDAGFAEKALFDAVGAQAEGLISRSTFSLDLAAKRPVIGKVNEMYKARSGKDLNDLTSREFTALLILADAINRAKSTDATAIRDALAATDLPGDQTILPWRRVKFDENGQNNDSTPVLLQYRNGKYATIFPAEFAVADVVWPMPKW
jgi:branched-chain amino acid transport system substrate-binding protein